VILDGGATLTVSGAGCTLRENVSTASSLPLETNDPHDVWCILGKLAEEGTILHLMTNIVHNIQLLAAALVLLSAHKEVDNETMYFIMIGVLGVDGVAVDAVHDIKGWDKVICTTAMYTPGEVEVDHLVLAHCLVLEMNPKEVGIIVGELIANARCKLLPCGLHHILLGHPLERADTTLILRNTTVA
jgi:hypothetical protein